MRRAYRQTICTTAFAIALVVPLAAVGQDIVTIKVKGHGIGRDGAVKDALRKAVEQGGQNEIASRSKTKDFAL
ncbi:MAG: hypothetical protein ACE5F9_13495, partial [Phycisphaerae bacterium]